MTSSIAAAGSEPATIDADASARKAIQDSVAECCMMASEFQGIANKFRYLPIIRNAEDYVRSCRETAMRLSGEAHAIERRFLK